MTTASPENDYLDFALWTPESEQRLVRPGISVYYPWEADPDKRYSLLDIVVRGEFGLTLTVHFRGNPGPWMSLRLLNGPKGFPPRDEIFPGLLLPEKLPYSILERVWHHPYDTEMLDQLEECYQFLTAALTEALAPQHEDLYGSGFEDYEL
jgi:hypothetical protein